MSEITFEEYTGKKCAVISDAGFIYSKDKSKKTTSKKEAASWYGCEEEDLVCIYSYSYIQSGYYFEKEEMEDGTKRLKVSDFAILYSRPKDGKELKVVLKDSRNTETENEGNWRRFPTESHKRPDYYEPHFYIYSDGRISHEDIYFSSDKVGYEKDSKRLKNNMKPHKLRTNPLSACNSEYYSEQMQAHLVLNNGFAWRGANIESFIKDYFVDYLGWPTTYGRWNCKLVNLEGIKSYMQTIKIKRNDNKGIAKDDKELLTAPPICLKAGKQIQIDKVAGGTLFRLANASGWDENYRIFVTNRGTVNLLSYDADDNKWESESMRDISWISGNFNKAFQHNAIDGDLTDLVKENPKFKYINSWINNNINLLLGYDLTIDTEKSWFDNETYSLFDFLRLANKYPALVESLIKLGYGGIFFEKRRVNFNVFGKKAGWGERKVNEKEITYFTLDTFYACFGHPEVSAAEKRELLSTLKINKFQWKFVTDKIKEDLERGIEEHTAFRRNFGFIQSAKYYFTGLERKWGFFSRKGWQHADNFIAEKLTEVSDSAFSQFYNDMIEIELHPLYTSYVAPSYYSIGEDYMIGSQWIGMALEQSLCNKSWIAGDIMRDNAIKMAKKCLANFVSINIYKDYSRMREACKEQEIEGFCIEDWPEMPSFKYVQILHDRLTELYNTAQLKKREQAETENQKMYNERIKKEKLLDFEYEMDDNERCVVCPKNLTEVILEGQSLSHCVGSYTSSIAKGLETILFLRKKNFKNTSYATIDIAYNRSTKLWDIRQVHTRSNGPITEEDASFLRKWAANKGINVHSVKTHYGALCHL